MAVQPPGIERRGDVARPVDRAVQIRGDLVFPYDEKHALRPVDRRCDAVAVAVDVDDLAGLAHAVGAAKERFRRCAALAAVRRRLFPAPDDIVIGTEPVVYADLIDRHAAADADAGVVERLRKVVRRFRAGGENVRAEAPVFQIFSGLFEICHGVQSSSMLSNPCPYIVRASPTMRNDFGSISRTIRRSGPS